jgi:GT2 family glycosyltransferase/glycosyltransferase involved in cell wall biosynthesis
VIEGTPRSRADLRRAAARALRAGATSESTVVRGSARLALRAVRAARGRRGGYAQRRRVPRIGHGGRGTRGAASVDAVLDRLARRAGVVVVIPVFNAPDAFERCLRSVLRHTTVPYRLLVMDDGSNDPRIAALLARAAEHPHVEVVRSEENRGFTRTVNAALEATGDDVVLLNSDADVGPGWLQGLVLAAHSADRVGSATPFSNDAGAFSAPSRESDNPLPAGMTTADAARAVRYGSRRELPRIPTGHGFCLYLRRRALEEVGHLDEVSFPRGYGEENDWCIRALSAGFQHILDDRTYVRHEGSASFGEEKQALLARGRQRLDEKHPTYTRAVRAFLADASVERARAAVGESIAAAEGLVRPRVLFVLHNGTGGTPATNLDLMRGVTHQYDCWTLVAHPRHLVLSRLVEGLPIVEREITLQHEWRVTHVRRDDYRAAVFHLLVEHGFELVHVRQLLGHTLELPAICRALGIPVVLSFHDFYLSCPTVHLVDDRDRFCGGRCTPGHGACRLATRSMRDVPPLKHAWVHEWRRHVASAFQDVDVFVTTSGSAREVMLRSHPQLADRRFIVVPHGRDLAGHPDACVSPPAEGPVRLLVLGNIGAHKGALLLRRLAELDQGRRLDLHFLGRTAPELYDVGTHHGEYDREHFPRLARQIAPSFVGVFAVWGETWSHTLTEAWSVGVPVLASDIGVLRERVTASGAGWCVDPYDVEKAYQQIVAAASDPVEHARRRVLARAVPLRTTADMSADYAEIYARLLRGRTL